MTRSTRTAPANRPRTGCPTISARARRDEKVRHPSAGWGLPPRAGAREDSGPSLRWGDDVGLDALPDNPVLMTPAGYAAMRAEYARLFEIERPALVETISWAAGNGDRSENGDYIYGRKRLREIDRTLDRLSRRMKAAQVVDPAAQPDRSRVFFGATVTMVDEDDAARTVTLVGEDEADAAAGRISWAAPLARALRGATVGDVRRVTLPGGEREYEVTAIAYPG